MDTNFGLSADQVELLREAYGPNSFPEIPMKGFCTLFAEAFHDTILLVLIGAAFVSLIVGFVEDPAEVRSDVQPFPFFSFFPVLSTIAMFEGRFFFLGRHACGFARDVPSNTKRGRVHGVGLALIENHLRDSPLAACITALQNSKLGGKGILGGPGAFAKAFWRRPESRGCAKSVIFHGDCRRGMYAVVCVDRT